MDLASHPEKCGLDLLWSERTIFMLIWEENIPQCNLAKEPSFYQLIERLMINALPSMRSGNDPGEKELDM